MKNKIFINIDDFGFVYDGQVEGGFGFIATNLKLVKSLYEYLKDRTTVTLHIYGDERKFVADDSEFIMFPIDYDVTTSAALLSVTDKGEIYFPFLGYSFAMADSFTSARIDFYDESTCRLTINEVV